MGTSSCNLLLCVVRLGGGYIRGDFFSAQPGIETHRKGPEHEISQPGPAVYGPTWRTHVLPPSAKRLPVLIHQSDQITTGTIVEDQVPSLRGFDRNEDL